MRAVKRLTRSDIAAYLRAARWILADPDRFCPGPGSQRPNGDEVTYCDPLVTRYSLIGAIAKVCGQDHWTRYRKVTAPILEELGLPLDKTPQLCFWLNARKRTQEEVLEVIDRAIARMETPA